MTTSELIPLAAAVPLAMAGLLAATSRWSPRRISDGVGIATAAAVVWIGTVLIRATGDGRQVQWLGGWRPRRGTSVGIPFVADRISGGLILVISALTLVALVFSWHYFEDVEAHYQVLMLVFLGAMCGYSLSGDLFDMFVFFELMGTATYALTGYKVEEERPLQAAVNFGVINSLGAYFTLTGIGLIYARTGELGLAQVGHELAGRHPDGLVIASFVLIVTGWLVKAAAVPFHFWLADAHAMAPAPVCVLFSGVMVELGLYGTMRVYTVAFEGTIPVGDVRRALLVVGVVTAIVGALMCVMQTHLKRMLAFSTIAHMGLFTCGAALLSSDGLAGSAVYIAGHAGVKAALFLCCGVLLNRLESVDEDDLHGRAGRLKPLAAAWFIAGLALCGLPPFGTYAGKSLVEDAMSTSGYGWGAALFVVVSALTGGAVIRAGLRVFFGLGPARRGAGSDDKEPPHTETERPLARTPPQMLIAIVVLIGGGLAAGVVPHVGTVAAGAAHRFLDGADYARQVLHHAPAARSVTAPVTAWSSTSIALGLLSTVLAGLYALADIHRDRLPPLAARLRDRLSAPVRLLRSAHSGHLGDYVAWLVVGIVGLAALVGVPLA
jgi:multicomponent Na+:H+ antiporter subunit D